MTLVKVLAEYITAENYDGLPSDVVTKVKRCLLDSIGCALGGFASEDGTRVARLMGEQGGNDATILGSGAKASVPYAALANSYLSNVLDFDDTYRGHPGCTVNPAAIGCGESVHASGKEVIVASLIGYEISSRVGASLYYSPATIAKIRGIMHQTFGAVSSACKILRLPPHQVEDALGIAGATTPVQSNAKTSGEEGTPPTLKIGFYACSLIGVLSALLAKSGITGPHNILDGDTGYWRMMGAERCDFEKITLGLDAEYEILKVAFKPYSCCRWFHSSLDALFEIMSEHKIETSEIKKIVIETTVGKSKDKADYLANPIPNNCVSAVFSLPYSVAVALSGIPPGPMWVSRQTMANHEILALAEKVQCAFQEKPEGESVKDVHKWPASVQVITRSSAYSKRVEYPRGSPKRMLTDEELETKFLSLAEPAIGKENARTVKDTVMMLEDLHDISELTALLKPTPRVNIIAQ